MRKAAALLFIVSLSLLMFMPAITVDASTTEKDTFVMAAAGYPETLDPAVATDTDAMEVIQNVYETLVWYNGPSTTILVPVLAEGIPTEENGGVTANGTVYVYSLRDDVRFHNGDEMSSADVVYSIKRLLMINDLDGPAGTIGPYLIPDYQAMPYVSEDECDKAIWASGPMTVQFNLTRPCPYFNYLMATSATSIVSKSFVEEHGGIVPGERNAYMADHACGTGKYRLASYVQGEYVYLERYDDPWGTSAILPHVNITTVPDITVRLNMINSGVADSAQFPREWESELEANEGVRLVKGDPTFEVHLLGLNQDINLSANPANLTDTVPGDFFSDVEVRLAFANAYNLQTSIDELYQDGVVPLNGIIPRGMQYYDASVPYQPYNLFTAAEHLNRAETGEGNSWGERGFRLTLYYDAGSELSTGHYACTYLKQGLEALTSLGLVDGEINVTVLPLGPSEYHRMLEDGALPIMCVGATADYADPSDFTDLFVHGEGLYAQRFGIENSSLDVLCEEAAVEMDRGARGESYHNISMAVQENCYYISAVQVTSFHVERTSSLGYYHNPMLAGMYFADLTFEGTEDSSIDRTYAILGIVGLIAAVIVVSVLLNKRLNR